MNPEKTRPESAATILELDFYDRKNEGFAVCAAASTLADSDLHEFSRESLFGLFDLGRAFDPTTGQTSDLAREIGQGLYRIVFVDELQDLLTAMRHASRGRGEFLRIVLRFSSDSALLELPWELLHDGRDFLALYQDTPIARSLRSGTEAYPLTTWPPLRVLFTTASSRLPGRDGVAQPLKLEEEEAALRAAEADTGGLLRVDIARGSKARPMTCRRLQHLFQTARRRGIPYHLWHHSGHGQRLERDGRKEFFLLLDRSDGRPDPIPPEFISRWITGPRDLRVAVLNLCHGGSDVGLGRRLAQFEIPVVIGMRTGVIDPAAAAFAQSFYKDLPTMPLELAVTSGRQAMISAKWPLEWAQPILFCRAQGPLMLLREEARAAPTILAPLGSPIFKADRIKARETTQVVLLDDRGPDRRTAFEASNLETDKLTQIAGRGLQTELEALRRHLTAIPGK